ncbi:hypothetical protein EVAR_83736_1 [Eumeta japonica]|uniref:Uncharacterized protein n=1 Tax=Eumeta variegata TaxID=151549 RepID=A0A4C1WAG0_EUMVA|nr:hypothetical protein EVAR_83736_1 [Eumeta japonica]
MRSLNCGLRLVDAGAARPSHNIYTEHVQICRTLVRGDQTNPAHIPRRRGHAPAPFSRVHVGFLLQNRYSDARSKDRALAKGSMVHLFTNKSHKRT